MVDGANMVVTRHVHAMDGLEGFREKQEYTCFEILVWAKREHQQKAILRQL